MRHPLPATVVLMANGRIDVSMQPFMEPEQCVRPTRLGPQNDQIVFKIGDTVKSQG